MNNTRLLFAAILMTASFIANAQAPAASVPAASAPAASAPAASAPAVTAPKPDRAEKFAANKERALDRIAKHLQNLQTLQTCTQAANDRAGLKACHKPAHPAHHGRRHHKENK
jgi:hypothetical protein